MNGGETHAAEGATEETAEEAAEQVAGDGTARGSADSTAHGGSFAESAPDGSPVDTELERAIVEAQIQRPLRAASAVVSRCALGLPVVVSVPPLLDTGEPFPTRHWLTCPLAHRRIARLEAAGGVRDFDRRAREDAAFGDALEAAHDRYARERDALIPAESTLRPRGGVAGSRGGVKCLHAHFADWRAHQGAAATPVGPEVAAAIEPLNCERPCVRPCDGGAERAPDWVEPSG